MATRKQTTKKSTRRRKQTTNSLYRGIDFPFADSRNYRLIVESVRNPITTDGYDWLYAVVNKATGVIEARIGTMPAAVLVMQDLDSQMRRVASGELNGSGGVNTPAAQQALNPGDIPL